MFAGKFHDSVSPGTLETESSSNSSNEDYENMEKKEHKNSLKESLIPKEEPMNVPIRKSLIERLFTKYFLIFGAFAGIMLGSNNFMTDYSVKQIDSYRVYCLSGFGMLAYFLLYHGTLAV